MAAMHTIPPKHSLYHRVVAALLARSTLSYDPVGTAHKQQVLPQLRGNILEIGPGGGPNLAFYAPDVTWLGIEPNPFMHPHVQRRAAELGRVVDVRLGVAEQLPVADASQDAVVGTLVLCSVHDPARALAEIVRVLKPGGQYIFVEHVAAQPGSSLRRVQNAVNPLWRCIADGCHANRESWAIIADAGFSEMRLEHYSTRLPVVAPHIAGVARK